MFLTHRDYRFSLRDITITLSKTVTNNLKKKNLEVSESGFHIKVLETSLGERTVGTGPELN